MPSHARAVSLMTKIMYQCRPARTTTMARCRACQAPSPGCLTEELGGVIGNRGAAARWLDSFLKVQQDEAFVFVCAKRVEETASAGRSLE